MRKTWLLIAILSAHACGDDPGAPPEVDTSASAVIPASCTDILGLTETRIDSGDTADVNAISNDFGLLFLDAQQPECGASIASLLAGKIGVVRAAGGWGLTKGWLSGVNVGLAITVAMQLGPSGQLSPALDAQLRAMIGEYAYMPEGGGCGHITGSGWVNANSCIDNYGVDAFAEAWIAAYLGPTGGGGTHADNARSRIDSALTDTTNSLCIHDPWTSGGVPCNGNFAGLRLTTVARKHRIFSLNHHCVDDDNCVFENAAYGIGMMSGIAAAMTGLRTGGYSTAVSADWTTGAQALLREAQILSSDALGGEFVGCYSLATTGPLRYQVYDRCGDRYDYTPTTFPVYEAYRTWFGGVPAYVSACTLDAYGHTISCPSKAAYPFDDYSSGAFYGNAGKSVIYNNIGNLWVAHPPSLSAPRYNAAFASSNVAPHSGPGHFVAGTGSTLTGLTITMTNTGNIGWTSADQIALGYWGGPGAPFGVTRVPLASGEVVAPGASKTFTFDVHFDTTPQLATFSFRMIRSSTWFGDPSPPIPVNITTWQGCFTDAPEPNRALPYRLGGISENWDTCAELASDARYSYMGLQYGGECWAGNFLRSARDAESACNMACSGIPTQNCGSAWHNEILQLAPEPAPLPAASASNGNFDWLYCDAIGGWAWNASLPNQPVDVDLWLDEVQGVLLARVTANLSRPDVTVVTHDSGYHGFNYLPPASVMRGYHRIYANYAGTSTPLWTGPREINCP